MKIEIRPTSGGVSLAVRAQPGAKKNRITGVHDSALKVAVTSPPEDGKANEAIVKFLAKALGCKTNQITMLQGKTDRRKVLEFQGMNPADLEAKIADLLAEIKTDS